MDFKLHSEFKPTGDQPEAIKELVEGFKAGNQFETLLGVVRLCFVIYYKYICMCMRFSQGGRAMKSIAINPLFAALNDTEKDYINNSIDFLYSQHHSEAVNDETQKVIDEALDGKGILGSYETVDDLMVALNA
ncbi:MAG: hypothetical protein J5842_02900 [Lachnospiraceae bacterium]|nr:hypothetical protein [Lachnospiraceae bacterium]